MIFGKKTVAPLPIPLASPRTYDAATVDYDWPRDTGAGGQPFGAIAAARAGLTLNKSTGTALKLMEQSRDELTYATVRMRQTPLGRQQLADMKAGFETCLEMVSLYGACFGEILRRLETAEARATAAEAAGGLVLPTGKPIKTVDRR